MCTTKAGGVTDVPPPNWGNTSCMPCVVCGMRIWLARAAHRYVPEYRLGWELPHQTQPWMTERAAHCLHKPQCKDTRRTPATTLQHTPAPIVQEVNVAPCKCTVAVDFDALCTITTLGGELSLLSSAMMTLCASLGCRKAGVAIKAKNMYWQFPCAILSARRATLAVSAFPAFPSCNALQGCAPVSHSN